MDPPVPPALGIYAAAVTVALTATDPDERKGARSLIAQLGTEEFSAVRARERRGPYHVNALASLIRQVLDERFTDRSLRT